MHIAHRFIDALVPHHACNPLRVMSQLNRDIERRQDKRPQLSNLRESGSLEERAKCVIGLPRLDVGDPIKGIDWEGTVTSPVPTSTRRRYSSAC